MSPIITEYSKTLHFPLISSLGEEALTFPCAHRDALNPTLACCTHEQDATPRPQNNVNGTNTQAQRHTHPPTQSYVHVHMCERHAGCGNQDLDGFSSGRSVFHFLITPLSTSISPSAHTLPGNCA